MGHVAKISLLISLFCAVGILLLALYIDTPNENYLQSVSTMMTNSERLDVLMLLTGCCLVGACAAMTWSVSLYNSLHVAGPLYRFTQNLQLDKDGNPAPMVQIRGTDYLQSEYLLLRETMQTFSDHYGQIENQLLLVREAVQNGDEEKAQELISALEVQIREVAIDV